MVAISRSSHIAFKTVQREVFALITKKPTILIGHSLENDLAVLKIVPIWVIDTSVRFTHPSPDHKYPLRYLSKRFLGRAIQSVNGGHDPAEDARAALDLAVLLENGVGMAEKCEIGRVAETPAGTTRTEKAVFAVAGREGEPDEAGDLPGVE